MNSMTAAMYTVGRMSSSSKGTWSDVVAVVGVLVLIFVVIYIIGRVRNR